LHDTPSSFALQYAYLTTQGEICQIMTTSSAGGFLCGYKPVVLAGSKEPLKIRHAHSYHRQAL